MPSASNYTNKIRFAASVKNTKAQLPGGVGNITQPSAAGCGLNIQYNPIDYVEICPCNVNPPIVPPPPPPPTMLDVSSWSYPGTVSFRPSNAPIYGNMLRLILTVNNDIVNNDMTIAFAGNPVSSARVGAIELTVNGGIISVPSGTFGLTDNNLNVVFQTVTNAGYNLSMTINPGFQDVYVDLRNFSYVRIQIYNVTGPSKPSNFLKFRANIDNLSSYLSIIFFAINGTNSPDTDIYATTSSGSRLGSSANNSFGGTVASDIICPPGTFVEGINEVFMKFSRIINTIDFISVSADI